MLKQFRGIILKVGEFLLNCFIIVSVIAFIPFALYHSTSFVLKHIICDDTYNTEDVFPLPSSKAVRVTAEFSINGNNEKVTKVVRRHNYWSPLNASGRSVFQGIAVTSFHDVLPSGDEVFYGISGESFYYWNKKTDTIKQYFSAYAGCPGAEMVDAFAVYTEELDYARECIPGSHQKYNLNRLRNGAGALDHLKTTFNAEFDNIRVYESMDVMVVPRYFWWNFPELREALDPITHEGLISNPTFNKNLWVILRDNLDVYGCLFYTDSNPIGEKSLFLNANGIWEIDWGNDYVDTYYYVKTLSHDALSSAEGVSRDFSFNIHGVVYTPDKQHSLSVFHPESGNIFFFQFGKSQLYLPQFLN